MGKTNQKGARPNKLGEWLKACDATPTDMAKELKCSLSTVKAWVDGRCYPKPETQLRVCTVLKSWCLYTVPVETVFPTAKKVRKLDNEKLGSLLMGNTNE